MAKKKKSRPKYISKGGTTGTTSRAVTKMIRRERSNDLFRKAANKLKALSKRKKVFAYVIDDTPHSKDSPRFKRERITKVKVNVDNYRHSGTILVV